MHTYSLLHPYLAQWSVMASLSSPFQDKIHLLWVKRACASYGHLSVNILREIGLYLNYAAKLVCFTDKGLEIHQLTTQRVSTLNPPYLIKGCIVTHMTEWEVLCVGSYPSSASAVSVQLRTCVMRWESPMSSARNSPGVITAAASVYVFGGYGSGYATSNCQKLSIATRKWSQLPHMDQPRAYFTPARYLSEIYLCDAARHNFCVSSFDLNTEQFKVHSQIQQRIWTNASLSLIVNDTLMVILQSRDILQWKLDCPEQVTVLISPSKNCQGFSCTETVQIEKTVYWIDYNSKKLVKFDTDTLVCTVDMS